MNPCESWAKAASLESAAGIDGVRGWAQPARITNSSGATCFIDSSFKVMGADIVGALLTMRVAGVKFIPANFKD
jgi:hypothetical protein